MSQVRSRKAKPPPEQTDRAPKDSKVRKQHSFLKIVVTVVLLKFLIIFATHHLSQWFSPEPLGDLHTVGFFGQKVHLHCTNPTYLETENTIIFHHSSVGEVSSWLPLQTSLAREGYRSCAYDRPGFGSSPLPQTSNPPTITENTQNLHELLQSLHFKGKFIHVGHELGGAYGLGYSIQFPDETAGLVLLDPILTPPPETHLKTIQSSFVLFEILSRSGISRLLNQVGIISVPDDIQSFVFNDNFISAIKREISNFHSLTSQLNLTSKALTKDILWLETTTPVHSQIFPEEIFKLATKPSDTPFPREHHTLQPHTTTLGAPSSQQILQVLTSFLKPQQK